MQEFDFYINLAKPSLGLYVRKGAGLPDLSDPSGWQLDGTVPEEYLSAPIRKELEENGHAFQELEGDQL